MLYVKKTIFEAKELRLSSCDCASNSLSIIARKLCSELLQHFTRTAWVWWIGDHAWGWSPCRWRQCTQRKFALDFDYFLSWATKPFISAWRVLFWQFATTQSRSLLTRAICLRQEREDWKKKLWSFGGKKFQVDCGCGFGKIRTVGCLHFDKGMSGLTWATFWIRPTPFSLGHQTIPLSYSLMLHTNPSRDSYRRMRLDSNLFPNLASGQSVVEVCYKELRIF